MTSSPDADSRIRTALEAGLPDSGLPGAVAAALTADGSEVVVALGARGVADAAPMTADTMFWIASMTKAITCVAALQLVAEGKIGLDDPVGPWLPELAAPMVLEGFAEDGAPRLRPARGAVTLRRLLTHTAGLGYDFASGELAQWAAHTGATAGGVGPPAGLPLLFDPGEGWLYGVNIDFAGRLIEALTGQDLGAALSQRIFRPLGMTSTAFVLSADARARLAPMHARLPDGTLTPIPFALPDPPYFQMGGGGLHSTAPDYLRFLRALLGHRPALLPPAMMALLTQSQVTEPRPGALVSVAPHLSNDFDAFPGAPTGWSLGFLVNLEPGPAGRAAGSLAWAGLSNCYYWLDPANGVAGVLLSQTLPFGDPQVLALFDRFERAVYGA
jgi:CubicO group peptidase (beta-lactamase class C family)